MSANLSFKLGHQEEILSGALTSTVRVIFGAKHRHQVGDRVEVLAGTRGNFVTRPVRVTSVKDTNLGAIEQADLEGGSSVGNTPQGLGVWLQNVHERLIFPRQLVQVVRFEYLD